MAARTISSRLSFLSGIPKLLAPFTLFAVNGILKPAVRVIYMNPRTAEMSRCLSAMEEHTDPSSAEYATILAETQQVARDLLAISIAIALVTLTVAFAKKIVARCFAAAGTTTTNPTGGAPFSIELLRELTKWHNLKLSLVTAAAAIAASQLVFKALLGDSGMLLSRQGFVFLAAFEVSSTLVLVALVSVALRRKEFSALVLLTLLLPALLIPVCALLVLYLYTERVMGLGLSLLSVYDRLQGVQDMLYLFAACMC